MRFRAVSRHRFALALLGLGCALAASCSPANDAGRAEPDKVRAIVLPYLTLMPMYIAQEEGFFAEQNLDVEFIRLARHQEIMASVASGDVDMAVGMLTATELNLAIAGAGLRAVAALGAHSPGHCANAALVARTELAASGALDDPERIRELVVDTDQLLPVGYWTDIVLQRHGVSIDEVELVNVPSPAAMAAIENGNVDLSLEGEPFVTMMRVNGTGVAWEEIDSYLPGYIIAMVLFGPTLVQERPEVGERLTVAILKAIRQQAKGKTPRNMEIFAAATGLEPELLEQVCWPYMPTDARIDPSVFRGYQEWSLERGLIDRLVEDHELFDDRFIEHANAALAR
jgi:NitT/TauT family transport system substrate-binding protein